MAAGGINESANTCTYCLMPIIQEKSSNICQKYQIYWPISTDYCCDCKSFALVPTSFFAKWFSLVQIKLRTSVGSKFLALSKILSCI